MWYSVGVDGALIERAAAAGAYYAEKWVWQMTESRDHDKYLFIWDLWTTGRTVMPKGLYVALKTADAQVCFTT